MDKRQDDYLSSKQYEGHSRNETHSDFSTFEHEGEYYFAVLNSSGTVRLRSEGYSSEKGRDNGIASVVKNRENKDMFSIIEYMSKFFVSLKAGNHQEIARSGAYNTKQEAEDYISGKLDAVAVAVAGKAIKSGSVDEYLPIKDYQGHKRTGSHADFSTFAQDGEFYFAMHDTDGNVSLRSEGYTSEKGRDNGIESVVKNREIEGRYQIKQVGNKYFVCLKAGNAQEIARSGAYSTFTAAGLFVSPAVAFTGEPKVLNVTRNALGETRNLGERKLVKENRKDLGEVSRKVTNETRNVVSETRNQISENRNVTKTAAAMAAITALTAPSVFALDKKTSFNSKPLPAGAGPVDLVPVDDPNRGFAWLLPLLLLFLIPFLIFGCPPPIPPAPVAMAVPLPVVPVVAPPVVCDCDAHDHRVFKLPKEATTKTLKKLGTFPEFGDSHALDGAGFYNKIKNKYATDAGDKRFLDEIFTEMGYDGFKDATADLFTEVTLKSGVEGNIGGGTMHKTYYRKLAPTNPRDLLAFRIEAKNGCHLHFMKTCGNHFFTKPCPADGEPSE